MRRASSSGLDVHALLARVSLTLVLLLASSIGITGRSWATPPIANTGVSSTAAGGNGAASPGPAPRWIGSVGGATINTGTGNKLTTIPLFAWHGRGGLPLTFALFHNSTGDNTEPLAPKWRFSYDARLVFDASGDAVMQWEDGTTFDLAAKDTFERVARLYNKPGDNGFGNDGDRDVGGATDDTRNAPGFLTASHRRKAASERGEAEARVAGHPSARSPTTRSTTRPCG